MVNVDVIITDNGTVKWMKIYKTDISQLERDVMFDIFKISYYSRYISSFSAFFTIRKLLNRLK